MAFVGPPGGGGGGTPSSGGGGAGILNFKKTCNFLCLVSLARR